MCPTSIVRPKTVVTHQSWIPCRCSSSGTILMRNRLGQPVYQPASKNRNMQNLTERSAVQPVDGNGFFAEVCEIVSERSAARPAPNPWNSQGLNEQLTYETQLLMYWARSRPVARIHLATVPQRRFCRGLRAAWTLWRMQELNRFDMFGCRGCGAFPTEATCAHCNTKWCGSCSQWSASCWKCYRPRVDLRDCGEFVLGHGGPGGNGSLAVA